ncbi:hypothetical protein Tco_0804445 [Tanacetum coccineum]|uniref:Uncharacterized protein n=1 Tax=Tanacetum coccineum TaxID=301880 RepID=A0ABQ5A875_9ASTR
MSKVLQERGFGSPPSSTETNPQDHVKSILTAKADLAGIRHIGSGPYAISDSLYSNKFSKTVPFSRRRHGFSIIDDMDMTSGVVLGMPFCKKFVSCQKIMERIAHGDECERMDDE